MSVRSECSFASEDVEEMEKLMSQYRRKGFKRAATLKLLPSRLSSRIYGAVNNLTLPTYVRPLVYGLWSKFFQVKTNEMEKNFIDYPTLTAFFTRRLKDKVRVINQTVPMVSPVDGAVVSISTDVLSTGILSQVKSIDYHIRDFLGIDVTVKPGNALFSCVLYLSPGDYHRFHASTEMLAVSRTHFAGQLLPVNPIVAKILPNLFSANERCAVFGSWKYGFYSYTAVGATNVGSIKLSFDPTVKTNSYKQDWHAGFNPLEALGWVYRGNNNKTNNNSSNNNNNGSNKATTTTHAAPNAEYVCNPDMAISEQGKPTAVPSTPFCKPHLVDHRVYPVPIQLSRGDEVGLFELGSTVVLIFEAPVDFKFNIKAGDKVMVGQPLGYFASETATFPDKTTSVDNGSRSTADKTVIIEDEDVSVAANTSTSDINVSTSARDGEYTASVTGLSARTLARGFLGAATTAVWNATAVVGKIARKAGIRRPWDYYYMDAIKKYYKRTYNTDDNIPSKTLNPSNVPVSPAGGSSLNSNSNDVFIKSTKTMRGQSSKKKTVHHHGRQRSNSAFAILEGAAISAYDDNQVIAEETLPHKSTSSNTNSTNNIKRARGPSTAEADATAAFFLSLAAAASEVAGNEEDDFVSCAGDLDRSLSFTDELPL